jgi:hypothetical protein
MLIISTKKILIYFTSIHARPKKRRGLARAGKSELSQCGGTLRHPHAYRKRCPCPCARIDESGYPWGPARWQTRTSHRRSKPARLFRANVRLRAVFGRGVSARGPAWPLCLWSRVPALHLRVGAEPRPVMRFCRARRYPCRGATRDTWAAFLALAPSGR